MLRALGIRRVAYDWRDIHVPTFEEEVIQYRKHGIEYFAFWDWHDAFEPLIWKHDIRPQIWKMVATPAGAAQQEKVAIAADSILTDVERARRLGCKLGIYNHGGWSGEPENMVQVCEYLRDHHDADHVGIVYNFHHGHAHIGDFASHLRQMLPWLLCINLNGMNDNAIPKIVTIGQGQHERPMIRTILESGYEGAVGIVDHQPDRDTEEVLRENLAGLRGILTELGAVRVAETYGQD